MFLLLCSQDEHLPGILRRRLLDQDGEGECDGAEHEVLPGAATPR
jgi:hypothetical protein